MQSTFLPQILWQGRKWRKFQAPLKDSIYYYEPGALPFLATFYPPQILVAVLTTLMCVDVAFVFLQITLFYHYFLSSLLSYLLILQWADPIVALFGSISLTYMASSIRIQHPCAVYTVCWIPGIFIGGWIGAVSLGMAILGGYWPILINFLPIIVGAYILWGYPIWPLLIGSALALPQIILTLNYYPRSIRTWKNTSKAGKVPAWKFLDVFLGDRTHCKINDVFSWEMSCYSGLALFLAFFGSSTAALVMFISAILSMTYSVFRLPCRMLHLFSFCLVWCATSGLQNLDNSYTILIVLIQAFLLLRNADIYPWYPFAEPIRKPSYYFEKESYDLSKFPYFTGYFHERATKGYTGGFCLKETALRHGITNPNGEGLHERN